MKKQLVLFFCYVFFISALKGQDLRGGYIQTKWMYGNTYSITVTLYIDSAANLNKPSINLVYGDGTSAILLTSSSSMGSVIVKKYATTHTYPGPGMFSIKYLDTFRIAGIKNITNSQTQPFYIESQLYINQFGGPNSSAILTNELINIGISGNQFMTNPGFIDIDGDSLSYSLGNCYTTSNYYLPGTANIDPTGTFTFSKDSSSLHAFVCKIDEWRKDLDGNYFEIGNTEIEFVTEIKSAVGIKELISSTNFKIYPNPVSSILNIESTERLSEIEIVNVLGQTVLKQAYSSKIDITELNSGVYYLKMTTAEKRVGVRKFIKN